MTPSRAGSVGLVGAGPGDPGLITRRGLDLLRAADVVLYDRLVAPELLREAALAERLPVGKAAGDGGVGQSAIHSLLVERARAGQRVVRLKGGDPFVFGRGFEELEACRAAGVPCEVVPGVCKRARRARRSRHSSDSAWRRALVRGGERRARPRPRPTPGPVRTGGRWRRSTRWWC